MVSQNGSPKLKSSNTPSTVLPVSSRVESLDLEAAAVNEEKHGSRHDHRSHGTPLERRTSAVNEAWPNAELQADPALMKEVIKEEKDVFLVTFDENDPLDPKVSLRVMSIPYHLLTPYLFRTGPSYIDGICECV